MTRLVLSALCLCLLSVVLLRAGLTRALVDDLLANKQKRPVTLRMGLVEPFGQRGVWPAPPK